MSKNIGLKKVAPFEWPYPVHYGKETEVDTDVLVLGGGIAGCWAAINAARQGVKVTIMEKAATIRSGAGGAGCDHWLYTANPYSTIKPEEMVDAEYASNGGYTNAISRYIASREGYDTLLEIEGMGGKIRDLDDEFEGAAFRDEKSKFCFAYDYKNKLHFRIWGTTFKPSLYNECIQLGVNIIDRTQATSLLTEKGKQGARVIGATGVNIRTGEFLVVNAKATVMCLSRPQRIWYFPSGVSNLRPHTCIGNGHAIAWRAGAALTQMERSGGAFSPSGYEFPWYGTGNPHNTWYACTIVDANGKEVPYVDRDGNVIKNVADRYQPAPGQKFMGERCIAYPYKKASLIPDLLDRIRKGEYKLPLYADLPGMPEKERKVIFGMAVGQEGKTKIPILSTYTKAGFDPKKDLLQSYIDGGIDNVRKGDPNARTFGEVGDAGGLVIDWDLKTTLEGLYAAGDQVFAGNYHHHAATTGRYAGRKAAAYSMKVNNSVLDRSQIETEKLRVYAPVKKSNGIEWKDLNHGLSMVMQNYCGELKNEELLKIGLLWLKDIEVNEAANACAPDPHKLGRTLDVLDLITSSQVIINACLARKASSKFLNFIRMDYPSIDPPDWNKWLTVRMENGVIKTDELSLDFEFPLSENYEKHNKDYQGWYRS